MVGARAGATLPRMISSADVARWCERAPTPDSPVLSVHLDVDQANAANLNRQFESVLKARLRAVEQRLDEPRRAVFRADAAPVERLAAEYVPRAKTLVVFSDASAGLFWTGELRTPFPTDVRWEAAPYVRPLVESLDRHERVAVVLVDKERARLATVHLGEIEEVREALAPAEVRRKNASGTDHWRSQMHFQRQDENHVRWHMNAVVALLDDMARARAFGRIVLAGPVETTSGLARLLPRPLSDRVVATVRLAADASPDDVLRETGRATEAAERRSEAASVGRLLDGGVVKLDGTLRALQEGRVRTLVYADGFESRGGECLRCGALFAARPASACAYCGGPLLPFEDLVGRAAARTVAAGGTVDAVHGEPALRLLDAGGIGAVLRY